MRGPATTILVLLLCAMTLAAGATGLNGADVVLCVDRHGDLAVEGAHAAHRGCHEGAHEDADDNHDHDAPAEAHDDHDDDDAGGGTAASCDDLTGGVQVLQRDGASPDDAARLFRSGQHAPDLVTAPPPLGPPVLSHWLGPLHPSGARPRAELAALRTFILLN